MTKAEKALRDTAFPESYRRKERAKFATLRLQVKELYESTTQSKQHQEDRQEA